jgi:hypothetical protein
MERGITEPVEEVIPTTVVRLLKRIYMLFPGPSTRWRGDLDSRSGA